MVRTILAAVFLLCTGATAAQPAAANLRQLDEVVVSGEQPGPGMWQIRNGEHRLFLLGLHEPLPKRMQWKSDDVEAQIARSAVLITPTQVSADSGLGMFRTMLLLPRALRVRGNPDDKTLDELVPPDLYARWEPLRDKYIRNTRKVEKRRPILAAAELFERAIAKSGLEDASRVRKAILKLAKRHKVEIVRPQVKITIEDPKALLQELEDTPLDDIACFGRTLERLEIELGYMRARANAWAIGDLEALRELPDHNQARACIDAVTGASVLQSRGFDDLEQRVESAWLEAVDAALATHPESFGWLSVSRLQADDGVLDRLRARGYEVIAPE